MIINIHENHIPLRSMIKIAGVGYVLGFGILMIPASIIILIRMMATGASSQILSQLAMMAAIPLILVLQGLMMSLVIAFGLWIYRWLGSIKIVVDQNESV